MKDLQLAVQQSGVGLLQVSSANSFNIVSTYIFFQELKQVGCEKKEKNSEKLSARLLMTDVCSWIQLQSPDLEKLRHEG